MKKAKARDKAIEASRVAFENQMATTVEVKTSAAKKTAELLKNSGKNNEKALGAFISKIADITDRLELLRWYADNHMECQPEEVTWGHVGSAAHVVEQLQELIDFLGITNTNEKAVAA